MSGFDSRPAARDAVIVAATRTPIGRAVKGSLAGVRPDDLAAGVIAAALSTVPALDPATLDDIYLGCAEPRDEHGGNLARRVAVQLGLDTVLMGFGLDSDAIHSPNEHYGVENFMRGIETIVSFYKHYASK